MIPILRAEFRKVFSVRSTYIILLLTLLIVLFYAGFITGYRVHPADLLNANYLLTQITGAIGVMAILGALVGLLIFGHEYRYNTIMYTLTASKSRSKVLVAKIIVVTVFALAFTVAVGVLSPLVTLVGINLHHYHLVSQTVNYGGIWWPCLLYVWGYCMLALIIVALIRNQVGAIAAYLLIPFAAEHILSLLLNGNSKYLPFTALNAVLGQGDGQPGKTNPHTEAFVALAYIVVGWVVAWILFLRRDAN